MRFCLFSKEQITQESVGSILDTMNPRMKVATEKHPKRAVRTALRRDCVTPGRRTTAKRTGKSRKVRQVTACLRVGARVKALLTVCFSQEQSSLAEVITSLVQSMQDLWGCSQQTIRLMLFDLKKENLPYTVAIIKPNSCLDPARVASVLELIAQNNFIVKHKFQRMLYSEEVTNLYYRHQGKPYFEAILNYMLSGECNVLLLCHETANPIELWKKLIGPADPDLAKKNDPNSLRAKFGTNLICNEFWGSDSNTEANKERDIFKFMIPQKIPQFYHDPYKIQLEKVMKFLFPPNLEHSIVNQRLDLAAQFGPVYNYHSVQQCLCTACSAVGKQRIQQVTAKKVAEEKARLGLLEDGTKGKQRKYDVTPTRMLRDEDIEAVRPRLCSKCRDHVDGFTHLLSGREMQHVVTDAEIDGMAEDFNRRQLLQLLAIEKGSAAKVMIGSMGMAEPDEIQYKRRHVEQLLKELETDYYGRFNFNHFRNLVLEDRRIRITYWVSKLTNKPVDRFPPVTALDQSLTKKQLQNHDSLYFTLRRTLPLTQVLPQKKLSHTPIQFEDSIIDKKKVYETELNLVTQKRMHMMLSKVVTVGQKAVAVDKSSLSLLRPYNEGRHGTWDNYSCLKGNSIKALVGGKHGEKLQ